MLVHQPSASPPPRTGAAFLLGAGVLVRRRRRKGGCLGSLFVSGQSSTTFLCPRDAHSLGQLGALPATAQGAVLATSPRAWAGRGGSLLPRDRDLSASCWVRCCFPASRLVTGVWDHPITCFEVNTVRNCPPRWKGDGDGLCSNHHQKPLSRQRRFSSTRSCASQS